MAYACQGAPNPELLVRTLKELGETYDALPNILPPPGFMPDTRTCYAMMRNELDVVKRIDGDTLRQKFKMDREQRERNERKRSSRSSSAAQLSRPDEEPRVKSSASASSSRRSKEFVRVVPKEQGGQKEGACVQKGRVVAEDTMWKDFAPMAAIDHVAQLMNHPLPTRGMGNTHDFHTRSSVGSLQMPLPRPPMHIAVPRSLAHETFAFGKDMKRACIRQKFNKDGTAQAQWQGQQKNHNSEHNDQMVQMGHIVRK